MFDCFKKFMYCTVVSWCSAWKIAQVSRKNVLQVMFYVGSIVRICFASYVLEGTLQILVSGLYWYFICVACSAVRKTFEQARGLKMTLGRKIKSISYLCRWHVVSVIVNPTQQDDICYNYCFFWGGAGVGGGDTTVPLAVNCHSWCG
jgi:hypothetical protein